MAATPWRALRGKSLCGLVRTSFTAGGAAAASGSTDKRCVETILWFEIRVLLLKNDSRTSDKSGFGAL